MRNLHTLLFFSTRDASCRAIWYVVAFLACLSTLPWHSYLSPPLGFYNVPVTKFLMLFIGSCSLLASILNYKQIFHLQLSPHITIHHQVGIPFLAHLWRCSLAYHDQFWRLFASHCAFTNSGELFFGLLLLYSMRVIERQFGSAKYAVWIGYIGMWYPRESWLIGLRDSGIHVCDTADCHVLGDWCIGVGCKAGLPQNPRWSVSNCHYPRSIHAWINTIVRYAIIFSALYQYHRIIPITYRFRIFGVTFNDKTFVFVPAIQVQSTKIIMEDPKENRLITLMVDDAFTILFNIRTSSMWIVGGRIISIGRWQHQTMAFPTFYSVMDISFGWIIIGIRPHTTIFYNHAKWDYGRCDCYQQPNDIRSQWSSKSTTKQ